MGRTGRKRRQKKVRNYCACDQDEDLILLNSWLAGNGVRRNKKLCLAVFDDTGRGVLTKSKIRAGEELINLPLNLTINVTTILMDSVFCSIFLNNKIKCLVEYEKSVSFQSLMAFYITYLKALDKHSNWFIYIENLPTAYTVPFFLPKELCQYIDCDIMNVILKQKKILSLHFELLKSFYKIL